jgi:hypothetical protein
MAKALFLRALLQTKGLKVAEQVQMFAQNLDVT